jgi:hypothetical protein
MRIVTIPGHTDFYSFTSQFPQEVQAVLDLWQKSDGVFHFSWIRGISGISKLDPDLMKKRMDRIFRAYLASPVPIWIMAQIRGISAHSMLIKKMHKSNDGYILWVVDSNRPLATIKLTYTPGEGNLHTPVGNYTFVPYLGFQRDLRQIATNLKGHCGNQLHLDFDDLLNVPLGDIELE